MVSTVSGAINDVGSRDLIELSRRGAAAWSDSSQTPPSATPNSDGQPVSVPDTTNTAQCSADVEAWQKLISITPNKGRYRMVVETQKRDSFA